MANVSGTCRLRHSIEYIQFDGTNRKAVIAWIGNKPGSRSFDEENFSVNDQNVGDGFYLPTEITVGDYLVRTLSPIAELFVWVVTELDFEDSYIKD